MWCWNEPKADIDKAMVKGRPCSKETGELRQPFVAEVLPDGAVRFVSESIENIPAGFRARETYRFENPGTFVEVFEMAEPGKDFEVYSRTRFSRKK